MINPMKAKLKNLPIPDRIQLVEDLWDSIAHDQASVPVSAEQRAELDRRLDLYEVDPDSGRNAEDALREIRSRL